MTEQLPFDIIMKILKMRNRDSQMSSPTAALIKREFVSVYYAHRDSCNYTDDYVFPTKDEFRHIFANRYFYWNRPRQSYDDTESEDEDEDEDEE